MRQNIIVYNRIYLKYRVKPKGTSFGRPEGLCQSFYPSDTLCEKFKIKNRVICEVYLKDIMLFLF